MTAYRTACLGFEYLLEFSQLLHCFVCNINYFLVAWRMRDEYTLVINIISARKTLGDVFFYTSGIFASLFFADAHLSVLDLNTRTE